MVKTLFLQNNSGRQTSLRRPQTPAGGWPEGRAGKREEHLGVGFRHIFRQIL
jgi:hypothetical protein